MHVYYLSRTQYLPISQDVAWAFFSNPANLLQLSPSWMKMRDETVQPAKSIYPGMVQILHISQNGLPSSRWVSEITHIDAPNSFIDEQKQGTFAYWHHRHNLEPTAHGVMIHDAVYYAMPFGLLGRLIHFLVVRRRLEALFNYRADMLTEFFGEVSL
jgi:ligand-binding SRPBCC domain-containing protein